MIPSETAAAGKLRLADHRDRAGRRRLWAEFALLFGGVPLVMLLTFGLFPFFPLLLALTGCAAVLLSITPGFRWRELVSGGLAAHWRTIALFGALCLGFATLTVWALRPWALYAMPFERTGLWLAIMLFYPFLSAAPQELIFRVLFFRRYAPLFHDPRLALAMNALCFGYGHLFYQNWVAITLSFGAGAAIGWAYWRTGSFPLAWALHAVAGMILFTSGLGVYFYHGAVG